MLIRPFRKEDAAQIAQLFHDTLMQGDDINVTLLEQKARAPDDRKIYEWQKRCSQQITLVADSDGLITGFGELKELGYIDCICCHRDHKKQGVGTRLLQALEDKARQLHLNKLYVEVSAMARPFYKKMGFYLIKKQTIFIRGAETDKFMMGKWL